MTPLLPIYFEEGLSRMLFRQAFLFHHFFHQDGRQTMMLHVRIHCQVDHMKTFFLVKLVCPA